MIIIIVIVLTALAFWSWMFIKNNITRWIIGGASLLLLALSILGLTLHFSNNWGMKKVTTTTTQQIYTAGEISAPYGMLIKAEIGKNTNNYVLVYRNNENDKKPTTNFMPDEKHITEAVKKSATYKLVNSDKAQVVTTKTTRQFSSNFMKFLFGVGGEQNELVKKRSVVEVPRDTWLVLTEQQVIKLQKEAPVLQAQMQTWLSGDPSAAKWVQGMQEKDPQGYAKLQVQEIKKLLGIND